MELNTSLLSPPHSPMIDGLSQVNPSRSQEDEDKIRLGREALGRQKSSWNGDWMPIAEALAIIQAEAMTEANTDRPLGTRYQKAMGKSLNDNGLKDLDKGIRSRLLKGWKHRHEIENWRAILTEPERLRYNHPNTVLRKWESRAQSATRRKRKSQIPELKEAIQRLEQEKFDLRRDMERSALALKDKILTAAEKALNRTDTATETVQADDSQFTEWPSDEPDVALFLPPDMPSDALQRLSGEISRLQDTFGLRCVWNAPIGSNEEGDNA